jgi:N-acetylglutamate synthase-like GNAT family acetyltransferase
MEIEYLADHAHVIPTLTQWAYEEWSYLHPERTYSEVERLISEGCNKENIPISLVAMDKGEVIGWAALKASDFKARPDLGPWLGGLYVDKPQRNKGVGTKLVQAIENLAVQLEVRQLFLVTDDAENFYAQLGWSVRERTESQDISVVVMEKTIVE